MDDTTPVKRAGFLGWVLLAAFLFALGSMFWTVANSAPMPMTTTPVAPVTQYTEDPESACQDRLYAMFDGYTNLNGTMPDSETIRNFKNMLNDTAGCTYQT
jgi:hypothetical protein